VAPAPILQLTLDNLEAARAQIPTGLWTALKHKEQLFVAAYLADPEMRVEAAALAAGFRASGAGSNGTKMLRKPTVRAAVDVAIEARTKRIEVDADRVLREVDTVSLSTIEHYRLTEDGNIVLAEGAPADAMRAISSIKYRTVTQKDGSVERTAEFKLWDKPGTLRLSMQHRGMLVEKHEIKLPPGSGVLAVPVAPSDAQWGAMVAAQQDALAGSAK
jgi:phage terminase small subunit